MTPILIGEWVIVAESGNEDVCKIVRMKESRQANKLLHHNRP